MSENKILLRYAKYAKLVLDQQHIGITMGMNCHSLLAELFLLLDQHKIGITMGMNCDSLLAELFLHAYETELLHGLLKNKR